MPNQRNRDLTQPLASAGLVLLLSACSGETINLGENTSGLEAPESSCPAPGNIIARNQADIDALAGCEVIEGDLSITPFDDADLRPLSSLREVRGSLQIGFLDFSILDENDPNGFAAIFAPLDERWLRSLSGLEGLERAADLSIAGFLVESLQPLSNLEVLTGVGSLQFIACSGFRDLSGLENLVGIRNLETNCDDLESLDGLNLAPSMGSVLLSAPKLKDLGSFGVNALEGGLSIFGTGLSNLDGLESLVSTPAITISDNPGLVNIDALDALSSVEAVFITGNAALERLPDFELLARIRTLTVAENPLLENLPSFPAVLADFESLSQFFDEEVGLSRRDLLIYRPDVIEITNNASLTSFTLAPGFQSAGLVSIQGNAALLSIGFSDVRAIDFLSIANNAALASVELGDLATVNDLEVSGNPALDLAVFDTLQTFSSELSVAPASAP